MCKKFDVTDTLQNFLELNTLCYVQSMEYMVYDIFLSSPTHPRVGPTTE